MELVHQLYVLPFQFRFLFTKFPQDVVGLTSLLIVVGYLVLEVCERSSNFVVLLFLLFLLDSVLVLDYLVSPRSVILK